MNMILNKVYLKNSNQLKKKNPYQPTCLLNSFIRLCTLVNYIWITQKICVCSSGLSHTELLKEGKKPHLTNRELTKVWSSSDSKDARQLL